MDVNIGDNINATLNTILIENELQKSLTDERIKAEEYKSNYESLKLDYAKLQQDYAGIMNEISNVYEEIKLIRERDRGLLEEARQDIIYKFAEIEKLKSQTSDSPQTKVAQIQLKNDIEDSFKKLLDKQECENEHLKKDFNKLKVENAFLKSEFENDKKSYLNSVDDLKSKYTLNLDGLKKEKAVQAREDESDSLNDFRMLKQLQRDNLQLVSRNKNLLEEREVVVKRRGEGGTQNLETLSHADETEKKLLKSQLEHLKSDLRDVTEEKDEVMMKNLKVCRQLQLARHKLEEEIQRLRREVADVNVEMMRKVGGMEKEKEKWKGLFEDARVEIEILSDGISKVEGRLVEREKETVREVQKNKEEAWLGLHAVEEEKLELESALNSLKLQHQGAVEGQREVLERLQGGVNDFQLYREKSEADLKVLRGRVVGHETLLQQLEKEKITNMSLKDQLCRLESQVGLVIEEERRGCENKKDLQKQVDSLENELQKSRGIVSSVRTEVDGQWRNKMASEGLESKKMKVKVEELELNLSIANKKVSNNLGAFKHRNWQMKRLLMRHKEKIHSLTSKLESADYNKCEGGEQDVELLRRKLREMAQKSEDFKQLLMRPQMSQEVVTGMTFAGLQKEDYLPQSFHANGDWLSLKRKIEKIGLVQDSQLEDLKIKIF